jgi:hypothetical protein
MASLLEANGRNLPSKPRRVEPALRPVSASRQ